MNSTKSMLGAVLLALSLPCLAACGGGLDSEVVEANDGYAIDILKLDGSETLAFAADDRLAPTEQSTIEFWVQPEWTDDPGYDPIVVSNTGEDGTSYAVAITSQRDGIIVISGETIEAVPFDFTDGELHFVSLVDYGNSISVSIDLELIADIPVTFESYPSSGLFIGTGSGGDDAFEGKIGGLRIWNVAVEPDVLAKYARADVLGDDPHPDLTEMKLMSDFANQRVIFNE